MAILQPPGDPLSNLAPPAEFGDPHAANPPESGGDSGGDGPSGAGTAGTGAAANEGEGASPTTPDATGSGQAAPPSAPNANPNAAASAPAAPSLSDTGAGTANTIAALAASATRTGTAATPAATANVMGTGTPAASPTGLQAGNPAAATGGLSPVDPNITATEAMQFSGQIGSFSDGDSNHDPRVYSVSTNWGDGTTASAGTVMGTNPFQINGTHTYAEEGTYNVVSTVTDTADGATTSVPATAYVSDAALSTVQGGNLPATQGAAYSGPVITFHDADPAGVASDYTALVNWGDSSTATLGTVSGGSGSFTVSAGHSYQQSGTFTAQVTITDVGGARVTGNATFNVAASVLQMHAATPALVEGASSNVTVATFTDPGSNTNPASYSATINWGDGTASSPGSVSYSAGTFTVTGNHPYAEEGRFPVTVNVTDNPNNATGGVQSTATVSDAVLTANGSPVSASAGLPFTAVLASFSDADPAAAQGDFTATINWGDNSIPTTGSIAPNGGSFQVKGGHVYASVGNYTVSITLNDAGGASATASGTATVTAPTQSLSALSFSPTEGQSFSGHVGTFTPPNPDPGPSAYAVNLGWGDGGQSSGTLTSNGSGGYWVSGSHTYADETSPTNAPPTPYNVTVTIRNIQTPSATPLVAAGSVTVSDAALTPTPASLTAWSGTPTGQMSVGQFSDASGQAAAGDFTASINWGDGSAASAGSVQLVSGSTFKVLGNHTYTSAGTDTVQITVTDDGGQTTTITSTMTVSVATASLSAAEGAAFSGVVASFTGNPAQATSATITWGDGNNGPGTITSTGGNSFTVSGGHTYADEGTYQLSITVQMSVGGPLTAAGPAVVSDAVLSAAGANVTGSAGAPLASPPNLVTVATFTDANSSASVGDFTASITWGDGFSSAGTVQANGGGWKVVGNHAYANAGSFTVTTTISDKGGASATANATASVGLAEGQNYSLSLSMAAPAPNGQQASPATAYTATITWGDGSTSTVPATPITGGQGALQVQVAAAHVYAEEGSYAPSVVVSDPNNNQTTASAGTVVVGDAPLAGYGVAIAAVSGAATGSVAVAGFSDANVLAASKDFNQSKNPPDYSATINWGDNTANSSGTVQANSDGSFTVLGSHTYAAANTYTVQTTITDEGGKSTTTTSTASVTAPWTLTGAVQGAPSNDPERAFLLPLGEAAVDLNQGALRLSQALDFDLSPGTSVGGSPALVYNSALVNVRPVVQLQLQSAASGAAPTSVAVQLTWNGNVQSPVTFTPSPTANGSVYLMAVQAASAASSSGAVNWSATVTMTFAGSGNQQVTTSGTAYVVSRDGSLVGSGWAIDGIPQLIAVSGGVMMVSGAGDSRFFAGSGPSFTSPAEDFGTLTLNGGVYTYTAKDQSKWNFNSAGQLTSVVDTHNLSRTYAYDGQNRLSTITAIDGGVTTLTYDGTSGLLNSISEPGSRVVQLQHTGTNLTQITDVDSTTRTFGYDGNHHLTSDQWAPFNAAFTYDATSGLLTQVNRGLGTTYAIASAAAQGLGTLGTGPTQASVTDGLSHTTNYLLDSRGRLLQQVRPSGSTDVYQRDAAGQVTLSLDPLHHPTAYTYAYGAYNSGVGGGNGDLVKVSYADGGFNSYRYDATFHNVTQTANALGVTGTNSYDGSTGDLLTSADALGNTTTYTWSNGLVQTVTNARGAVSSNVYDTARRLIVSYDNLGVPTVFQYDANGNPSATIDAYGRTTQTVYNNSNELVQTIDANAGTTSQTYTASGLVTSSTNARGFTRSTVFDQRGWAASTTDEAGATSTNQFDKAGNVTQTTDARGNSSYFTYDVDNRPTVTTDALGNVSTTVYDAAANVVSTTDPLLRVTSNSYDTRNRPLSTADPMQRTNYVFYDLAGNVVRTVDGRGLAMVTSYDADNRPSAVTDPDGNTSYTYYDQVSNVVETVDALGQPSFFVFDADNRQIASYDPDHFISSQVYDLVGNAVQSIDERGKVSLFTYDLLYRQIGMQDSDGDFWEKVFDPVGNVIETIDANSNTAFHKYDPDNRLVSTKDEDHYLSQIAYDLVGNVVVSVDQNGQSTLRWYDALNRPVLVLDADGHLTQTVYNAVGDVVATVDANAHTTQDGYNADDEQTSTRDGNGSVTQQQTDADGQVSSVTDPNGNTTTYLRDGDNNVVATVDTQGRATVSVYDKDNQLVSVTDRNGRQRTYAYDADGRLLTETWYNANGTVYDTLHYTYDPTGNLLTASNSVGTYTYTYDNAGRVLTQQDPFGLTLTYGYDHNGNTTSVQDSLGGQVTSVYDGDSRLSSRQFGGTGQTPLRIDLTYTGEGQVATETRYKDLAGTQKVGYSTLGYDPVGNVTSIVHQNGTGGQLASYTYTYDSGNRLTSETDNGTTTNYGYDSADQLTSAGTSSFSFDANGNRTMTGYSTGADNRMSSDGTWNYQYDNEGNVTLKTKISNGETWAYTWDNANQLISAIHKDGSGTLLMTVVEKYDVFGNRVEEDVTPGGGQTTVSRFAFDGNNAWADLNGSNQLQMRRLYLDGDNQPFARITSAGVATWYLTDHLGSVRDLMDNLTSQVVDHVDYDAWGNVTNETQPTNGDRVKFAGGVYEAVLGLELFQARWVDPVSGRWVSQDPLGLTPDSNPYRDVGNGPTNATDPTGEYLLVTFRQRAGIVSWFGSENVTFAEAENRQYRVGLGADAIAHLKDYRGAANFKAALERLAKDDSKGYTIDEVIEESKKNPVRIATRATPSQRSSIYAPGPVVGKNSKGNTVVQIPNRWGLSEVSPKGQLVPPRFPVGDMFLALWLNTFVFEMGTTGLSMVSPEIYAAGRIAPLSRVSRPITYGRLTTETGWQAPKIVSGARGQLTNGKYTLDLPGLAPHATGSLKAGKSQFLYHINEKELVLDAAAYADKAGLWVGNKAKVIFNKPIGVHAATRKPTTVLNVYRTKTGFVHGAPGSPK